MHGIKQRILIVPIIAAIFSTLVGCESEFDAGYAAGYSDAERDLRYSIEEEYYDEGYTNGYNDAECDFYDARFIEGYESGYSDGAAGKECVAVPRGDDYVWLTFIGEEIECHKYTLPLPPCATARSTSGFPDPADQIMEEYIPCDTCFPNV